MGVFRSETTKMPLGLEMTGKVRRVGRDVQKFAEGDRVCGIGLEGCFSTHVVLPEKTVTRIPRTLGYEEGATMPICFTTAVLALMDIGQMKQGNVSSTSSFLASTL